MPTIEVSISDLESLLEEKLDQERLEILLEKVKGEVKDFMPETDLTKIELNDTNRPDLWSPEGIVRQIHPQTKRWRGRYPFFDQSKNAPCEVNITEAVSGVRPYIAACISREMTVTEPILQQLIQTQEKLAESFGRKRETVSIGLYRLNKISFPVRYDLVPPETTRFVPLGFEEAMSLKEIIENHPKGIAYAKTLEGAVHYPILSDARGEILSFPPIINSRTIGEIEVGDSALFVEVTGTDLRMVILAINIFAANLKDRGAVIEPVRMNYPGETPFGRSFQTPYDLSEPVELALKELNQVLGESVPMNDAVSILESYGLSVERKGERMTVTSPPFREDIMHPIDVIEDFAISRGYASFIPDMPTAFTVGGLSEEEQLSDTLRDIMIGFGFEEIVSNVLGSREDFVEKMCLGAGQKNRPEARIIEIENPMTERHALLRSWLLPSLLRTEGASSKAFYPHRLFEVGEVAQMTQKDEVGAETLLHLGTMIAHPNANFSELHAILESLFHRLSTAYRLEPFRHASFIEGRSGTIMAGDKDIGLIGELAPEVLDAWQIGMPTVAFELDIETFRPKEK